MPCSCDVASDPGSVARMLQDHRPYHVLMTAVLSDYVAYSWTVYVRQCYMPLGGGGGGREAEHMVSTVHLTTNSLSNTGTDREHCGQMELYRRIWNNPAAENTTHTHS